MIEYIKGWAVFITAVVGLQVAAFIAVATSNPIIKNIPPYSFMGNDVSRIILHCFVGGFAFLLSLCCYPE